MRSRVVPRARHPEASSHHCFLLLPAPVAPNWDVSAAGVLPRVGLWDWILPGQQGCVVGGTSRLGAGREGKARISTTP